MEFNYFKNNITIISKAAIGGMDAQFKLAPSMRLPYTQSYLDSKKPRKAAVIALFYPNKLGETCFLLTQRANYNGVHASQISFPGGKFDSKDKLLQNTAIREAEEEVGVEGEKIIIFKEMTNVFIPPSNFLVTPFLGLLDFPPIFKKNYEVEKIIDVSLKDLMDDTCLTSTVLSTSYAKNISVPCFNLNNYTVWGATAMMLSEIKELIKLM